MTAPLTKILKGISKFYFIFTREALQQIHLQSGKPTEKAQSIMLLTKMSHLVSQQIKAFPTG